VDSSVLHRVDDLLDNNKNEEKQLLEYLKYLYNENNNEYEKQELIRKLFYSTKKLKKLSSLFFSQKKSPNKFDKKIIKNSLDNKQSFDNEFDAFEIKKEIRDFLELRSPSLYQHVDRMLRDYHGKEKVLLDKLCIELGCSVPVINQDIDGTCINSIDNDRNGLGCNVFINQNIDCSNSIDTCNSHIIRSNEDYDTSSSSRGLDNLIHNRSAVRGPRSNLTSENTFGSNIHHIISENHSTNTNSPSSSSYVPMNVCQYSHDVPLDWCDEDQLPLPPSTGWGMGNKDYKSSCQLTQSGLSSLSSPHLFNSVRYMDSSTYDIDNDKSSSDNNFHRNVGTRKYDIDNNLNFCHLNVIE
jgi:hypothetical protein